jgi:hypothetical protein
MSKTLLEGQGRVYAYLKQNPEKSEKGGYGREEVTFAINTAQRFVSKGLPIKALGSLVRLSTKSVDASAIPSFAKTNQRVVGLAYGVAMTDEIPLLPWDEWIAKSKTEVLSNSDLRSFYATEMGNTVYIRPAFPAAISVQEFSVDDTTDMEDAADTYSTRDDEFEWVNLNAAALLLMAGGQSDKLQLLTSLMTMWSTAFRGQFGIDPPNVLAAAASGKVE